MFNTILGNKFYSPYLELLKERNYERGLPGNVPKNYEKHKLNVMMYFGQRVHYQEN